MDISPRQGLIFLCCLLVLSLTVPSIVVASSDFGISIENTVETPTQTVEFENDKYKIDSIAVYDAGETMPVDVTLPASDYDIFDLLLYNDNRNIERSQRTRDPTTSESVDFDTSGVPPGTYSLNLEVDGSLNAVHPVVVPEYDLSIDVPDTAIVDEDIEIEVSVTPAEDVPAGVEVILWTEDHTKRVDATADGEGTYTTTVALDDFETTDYNVYATALGDDTVEGTGEKEILGIGDAGALTVSETGSSSGPGGNVGGGGGAGGGGAAPGTTPEENSTAENGSESENGTNALASDTAAVVDEAPDESGVRISFQNTTTRVVTLSNETADGEISVADRSGPPEGASVPAGSMIATVEITVPPAQRNTSATVELAVDSEAVSDPEQLTVERYDVKEDTWTRLATTVTEQTDSTITVTAETPGFSVFAVTETDDSSDSENSTATPDTNRTDGGPETSTPPPDEDVLTPSDPNSSTPQPADQPGFGVVLTAVALLLVVALARYRW